ncbi:MAG TPA: aldehyde dehydrogenase family protein [Cyclobacteriaceae bacterium]|nr:aldehyde dehydrogenase family protein [Cyclobacteriaceae bacterium]
MVSAIEQKEGLEHISSIFDTLQKASTGFRKEPTSNRKKRLEKLRIWIKANRTAIQQAIHNDFRKPAAEVDTTEIFPALDEIKLALDNLDRWTKPKKVDAPITMLGTRATILYEPKGLCLIISPWNYPFNLSIGPLVSALVAGNNVIIKPSEHTPHTSALIKKMCEEIFDANLVTVCEGGPEVSQALLKLPFDHIFFTGSPSIGKVVMKAAAENLTSVTLELGGKSPTIVTASASIKDAAQRIAVAKFINNGQTCIAPDYVLVDERMAPEFINKLKEQAQKLFSENDKSIQSSPHYARIVNQKHYDRLNILLQDAITKGSKLEMSGPVEPSERFIHPMILSLVPPDTMLMEEEIFGPILPVLTFKKLDDAIEFINKKPKPLALYFFGSDKKELQRVKQETSSGALCVNDCAIHFLHHNLPFGGVNNSGIGKSHGYHGFMAFSNEKPVLKQMSGFSAFSFFYPPYTPFVLRLINWLLKMF